jgi:tetratricopeptide (TPR) repeat protein
VLLCSLLLSGCGSAQSRKAGYIARGQQYFSGGRFEKARVEFSNAAQIDPKDGDVRFRLGQVAEKLEDVRGAIGQYQSAIYLDAKNAGARAALGRIFLYAGLPDKALQTVEPGLANEPDSAQLLTVRAGARAQLRDIDAALKDAQRAVQLAPADEYAIAVLASLYRQHSQLDQAIAVTEAGLKLQPKAVGLHTILADLELAESHPAQAEEQLKQVIALEPQVLPHRTQLALLYLHEKNVDAAEQTLREAVSAFPSGTDAKLQLVEFLAAQRSRSQALAQADQFVSQEPSNETLKLALGPVLVGIGQVDRAEQLFRDVITRSGVHPNGLMARDRLAALLLTRNDVTGATALIGAVLHENPRDNDALILRASLALSRGDPVNAIADLRAVLRDQPNAVPLMRTLASAYVRNGEAGLAEETLRTAVQVSPKDFQSRIDLARVLIAAAKAEQAEPLLEQLAKENPTSVPVHEALFRAQAAQKHDEAARATALNIQRLSPKLALGYYLEGLVNETQTKPDAAVKDYEQALQLAPDASEPLTALVRLDLLRKQPDAAMARIDAAIARSPADGVARDLKGDALMIEGKTEAAIVAYSEAVRAAPNLAEPYHGLAVAQLRAQRNDEAIHTLKDGITKTQDSPVLLNDLSNAYIGLRRPEEAIALYQGVLTQNPGSYFAVNNLAMLLVTYRTDGASLERAQKLADELSGSSVPTVIDTRGWVKFKSGDFHGAESLLQQAVDKSPNAPELRYHLAMAQLRSGEQQAAQQNLESALHVSQSFAGADEARTTLAQLQKNRSTG